MHALMNRRWGRGLLVSFLLGAAGPASAAAPLLTPETCSVETMLRDVRAAMKDGSPALKHYVKARLREAALAMPAGELQAALEREHQPEVLEALGAALATKASHAESPGLVQPLLARAAGDADPAARAAAVRALRATPSVEFMAKNGGVVTYEQLVRDSSPEVRQAVADNLLAESAQVYSGHDRTVSETTVAVASAAEDPAVAARLLSEVSMEAVGHETVERVTRHLKAESPELRAAAATALGGAPGAESAGARRALVEAFRGDSNPAVRKAALEGIARLGQASARPLLESLRGVDARMDPEIDAWLSALKLNLQEWHLLLREKQRLRR